MKPKSPKNPPKKHSEKLSQKSNQKVPQKAPKCDPKTTQKGEKNENCENTFFSKSKKWIFIFFGSKIKSKIGPKTRHNEKVSKTLKSMTLTAFEHGF